MQKEKINESAQGVICNTRYEIKPEHKLHKLKEKGSNNEQFEFEQEKEETMMKRQVKHSQALTTNKATDVVRFTDGNFFFVEINGLATTSTRSWHG